MKCNRKIKAALVGAVGIFTLSCCDSKQRISESEDETTYLLVGEPCAEGDYTTAIRRADSLLAAPVEMSDTLRAYIMIDRDVSILEQGNSQWGVAYADTVIEFGKRHGIGLAVMQGLQNKGIISRRNGDWETAISLYKEGLGIAVEEDDEEMQQVFSEMLAIACAEHGLNEEAYSFGQKSLEMARQMKDSIQEFNAASTLSAILVKQGKFTEAVNQLRPYQEMSKGLKTVYRVKYLTPLLKSYLELDSLDKVRQILRQTHDALEGMATNTQAYYVAINAEAVLAHKEGRYADEWRWLQKADSIGTMGTTPDNIYEQRALCLAHLGRYKEAYEYQAKATAATDSLRTSDNDRRLSELMIKYDTLSKENAITHLKAQRLGWGLVATICLIAAAALIVFIILYRMRIKRRLDQERREEYLKGLEHERKRIAGELHDDIAGRLIGLQLRLHAELDKDSEDMLMNLIKRVRTMSHELMPPEFKIMNFIELLEDLATRLNNSPHCPDILLERAGSFSWEDLNPEECHEVYRIIQESVKNAALHGDADKIWITLTGDELWKMEIASNFIPDDTKGDNGDGIGLRSLKNRAAKIGASMCTAKEDGKFIVYVKKENK